MWWRQPVDRGFGVLVPERLLMLIVKAYVLVLARTQATGPEAGRVLERAFYNVSAGAGMQTWERAGSRSLFSFKAASGYAHEIDCSTVQRMGMAAWELKNLQGYLPKNELLVFHGKVLDYYQSFDAYYRAIPLYRLLMTTGGVDQECRQYGVANGIMLVDPSMMPIPLLHGALSRGMSPFSGERAMEAARMLRWACRPLQDVLSEMSSQGMPGAASTSARARAVIELQARLSGIVWERLQQEYPDWEGELLNRSWRETGGWVF